MTPRGRLFRKYVVVFVGLVSGALLASGATELYFSYQENKTALVALQREKAAGAASRIVAFVEEIERQIGWTTQPQLVAPSAALEQRRVDYLRLLRQVPAITELSHLDATGKEQLRVSRLAMDAVGSQADFSNDPKFREAKAGKTYFGPLYFRRDSEPYMTISMPQSGGGVTVAEVNLKFIWDVISKIKIGKAGRAFVVDGAGMLIAHPDISLVLQKTTLQSLEHVHGALFARPGAEDVTIARDVQGRRVLTAHARIDPPRWFLFVEQPLEEAFEPLYASITRAVVLLVVGVALSIVASLALARKMMNPIRALQAGAAQIGAGDLGARIDVKTGDELEALADQFNRMTGQLQESYATLEHRVVERTRELTEALEQQTGTSEILRVISSSPTDVQPVFDAIVRSAVQLCGARFGAVFRFDGTLLHFVAHHNLTVSALAEHDRAYPAPPERAGIAGRAIVEREVVLISDVERNASVPATILPIARAAGFRSAIAVPMLKDGLPVGTINVARAEPGPFSDKQVQVLRTFADQAVIAIENVRLFTELQQRTRELTRSVDELTALGEVGRAVSSTLDLETVLTTIVARATLLAGVDAGVIYEYDEQREVFEPRATERLEEEIVRLLVAAPIRKGEGATGRVAETREPVQLTDIHTSPGSGHARDVFLRAGYRSLLAVPLVREDHLIGALTVIRRAPGEFSEDTVNLLKTFATQSALAIQNARLFLEIEEKGQQLEVANRHKSEFLANMSHELRTPLNAIIGFSEVLIERMFGELNDKQDEYLKDIYSSGRHLLSLINDILDLSKVEAGRMELDLTTFDLPEAMQNALTLVRGRADAHTITLAMETDERLGDIVADERKVKQILLNLLSNAVKFTPDGGRIGLRATPANGSIEISVTDSGVGIAPEDQAAVFEEFRQVGTDYARKREGTGLGLALTKKFVELHGGTIWVKSTLGHGSTFGFTLPVRVWPTSSS